MVSTGCETSAHYSPGNLLARLKAALIDDGIDPEHPTIEALAPYVMLMNGEIARQAMANTSRGLLEGRMIPIEVLGRKVS
jgi:hypothetical protein